MILGTQKSRAPLAVIAARSRSPSWSCSGGSPPQPRRRGGSDAASRATVAKKVNGKVTSKIVGTARDGSKVAGTFSPLKFVKKGGKPGQGRRRRRRHPRRRHQGDIHGPAHPPGQEDQRPVAVRPTARSAQGLAACDILHLILGPLDLDLLGLQVHLDKVVLDIVATPGAGNLLGNLLCAVTGLLDGGPLAGLLGQLNDLLGPDPRRLEPRHLTGPAI